MIKSLQVSLLQFFIFIILLLADNSQVFAQVDTWTQKADFAGGGRDGAVGFSIGSKGYIGTGSGNNTFWEIDPISNTWTQKADFGGVARTHAVGFSIGSKGYIGTGKDLNSVLKKDFWEFDPASNTWTQKADFGGGERDGSAGFSIGSKGYIGTGLSDYGYVTDFWEFDPSSNTWTQKTPFGGRERYYSVGFSIGTKGYIGTGFDGTGGISYAKNLKDFWEFDPASNTWIQKADFGGTERYVSVGFSIGSKGYIGTGFYPFDNQKDFWEFDPITNKWTKKADFAGGGRGGAVGFSIGSKGYIGTGNGTNDFWEYNPYIPTPPNASITASGRTTFCTPGSVVLSASTSSSETWTYQWALNGSSLNGATANTYTANQTGSFTLTVTNSIGQSVTSDATNVIVNQSPTATISSTNETCLGAKNGSITITASGTPTIQYSIDGGSSYQQGNLFTNVTPGNYSVIVKSGDNCPSSAYFTSITAGTVKSVVKTQDITINLDNNGTATISPSQIDNGSSSDCGIASYSLDKTSFDCSNIGGSSSPSEITYVGSLSQDTHSYGAGYNPNTGEFLYPQWPGNTVYRYNSAHVLQGTFTAPQRAMMQLCMDKSSTDYYIANWDNYMVNRISANSTILWTYNASTYVAGISTDDNFVYVSQNGTNVINVLNKATGVFIKNIQLPGIMYTYGGLAYSNGKLYMGGDAENWSTIPNSYNVIHILDLATGTYVSSTSTQVPIYNMAFDGKTMWVSDNSSTIYGYQISNGSAYGSSGGVNLVTLTVTDNYGNQSSATAKVTVVDKIAPLAKAQDVTVYLDVSGNGSTTAEAVNNGSSDACGIQTLSLSQTAFTCVNVGKNPVTLTVTDKNGNQSTAIANVIVVNKVAPTVKTQDITMTLDKNGSATITPSQIDNGSTDNCGIASYSLDKTSFDCSNVGGGSSSKATPITYIGQLNQDTHGNGAGYNPNTDEFLYPQWNGTTVYRYNSAHVLQGTFTAPQNSIMQLWMDKSSNDYYTANWGNNQVLRISANKTILWTYNTSNSAAGITTDDNYMYLSQYGTDVINVLNKATGVFIKNIQLPGNLYSYGGLAYSNGKLYIGGYAQGWSTIPYSSSAIHIIDLGTGTYVSSTSTLVGVFNMAFDGKTMWVSDNSSTIYGYQISNGSAYGGSGGGNVVTLTVTDKSGNQSSATAKVTVLDKTAPLAKAQDVTVYLDASGNASTTAEAVNNGSTDACGIQTLSLSQTSFTCVNVGINPLTLTVTDKNGNQSTATANVTVVDNVAPTAKAQDVTVYLDVSGNGSTTAEAVNNGSTDACGIQTLSLSQTAFTCANVGKNPVTLTVIDKNGNKSTATANVTVVDKVAPVVKTQDITITLDKNGSATITPSQIDNGSTDNCGIASYSLDKISFDCSNVGGSGANIVNLTVTDIYGNSSSAPAKVTVQDLQKPIINTNGNKEVPNDNGVCGAAVTVSATATDNCSVGAPSGVRSDGLALNAIYPVGITTITWNVKDINGNDGITVIQTVKVSDKEAPILSVPANIIQNTDNLVCYAAIAVPKSTATDNCGIVKISSDNSYYDTYGFAPFNKGVTVINVTATDSHGNKTLKSFTVTVIDNQFPTITGCPSPITAKVKPGTCGQTVYWTAPTASDNCPGVTLKSDHLPGEIFPVGTTPVTYTAIDASGNKTLCTFNVTVLNNVLPNITKPENISVKTSGLCGATVKVPALTAKEKCSVIIISNNITGSADASGFYAVGISTIIWTATDVNGNKTTIKQTITVEDEEKPTISVQSISAVNEKNKCGATLNIGIPVTKDNCGIASVTNDRKSNFYPVGTTLVKWTVTDTHNNIATITQTVMVADTQKPDIICPANQVLCENAKDVTYLIPALTASDNCGIASISYIVSGATIRKGTGNNASGLFKAGVSTISWTVTDVNKNVSTCSFTVTINPLPIASYSVTGANEFCNKTTLTAIAKGGPFTYQWSAPGNKIAGNNPVLQLGIGNADGPYNLKVTDKNGCKNDDAVTYDFRKQNQLSSYVIVGSQQVDLGNKNLVNNGSVGVTGGNGQANLTTGVTINSPGAFLKSAHIKETGINTIASKILSSASPAVPTMVFNTSTTGGLPNYISLTPSIGTLAGNYNNISLPAGSKVTLSGSVFGILSIGRNSDVTFSSPVVNMVQLKLDDNMVVSAQPAGTTSIHFSGDANVLISKDSYLGINTILNAENRKVTFYIGKVNATTSNNNLFTVGGGNTQVIANIYAPSGIIKINQAGAVNSYVTMTGLFIGNKVIGQGVGTVWNSYDCNAGQIIKHIAAGAPSQQYVQEDELKVDHYAFKELTVKVSPNPTSTNFRLEIQSNDLVTPAVIKVIDVMGRPLEMFNKVPVGTSVTFGQRYAAGSYYAQIQQGRQYKVVKLIKVL